MKSASLIIVTLIALLFASCDTTTKDQLSAGNLSPRTDYSNYKLQSSDLATIGGEHNALLQDVFDELLENTPELEDKEGLRDYFTNFPFDIEGLYEEPGEDIRLDIWDGLSQPITGTAGVLVGDILEDWAAVDDMSEVNSLISSALSAIEADTSLSVADYNAVASYLAVLKYSSYFWFDTSIGGSGLGRYYMDELNDIYPDFFEPIPASFGISKERLKQIAAADAIGAAIGMLKWCVIGACTGVGTVAGFVGGALYGGVEGSLGAAAGLP